MLHVTFADTPVSAPFKIVAEDQVKELEKEIEEIKKQHKAKKKE